MSDRGVRMEGRLHRTLEAAGFGPGRIAPILESHREAMERRRELLDDDHHFAFLHPGRTVLVAVTDAGVRDPSLLALAPLIDSLYPWMAPRSTEPRSMEPRSTEPRAEDGLSPIQRPAPAGPTGFLHPLPLSGLTTPPGSNDDGVSAETSELLEHLIALEAEPLALVLAEALDHLRHLHLSDDRDLRVRVAERTREVLLPLAERAGGTLNRRYRWWWRRVGRGMRDGD